MVLGIFSDHKGIEEDEYDEFMEAAQEYKTYTSGRSHQKQPLLGSKRTKRLIELLRLYLLAKVR